MAEIWCAGPYFDTGGAHARSRYGQVPVKATEGMAMKTKAIGSTVVFGAAVLAACATVKVQAPDKPIEINMNVNIKQEVLIKIDQEIADLIANNPDIF